MAVAIIRDPAWHQFPRRFKDGIGRPGHQMVVETLDIAQKIERGRRCVALPAKPGEMGLDRFALPVPKFRLLLRKDPRSPLVAGREHRRRGAQVCANSLERLLDLLNVLRRRLDAPLEAAQRAGIRSGPAKRPAEPTLCGGRAAVLVGPFRLVISGPCSAEASGSVAAHRADQPNRSGTSADAGAAAIGS